MKEWLRRLLLLAWLSGGLALAVVACDSPTLPPLVDEEEEEEEEEPPDK